MSFDPTKPVRTKAGTEAHIVFDHRSTGRVKVPFPLVVEIKDSNGGWFISNFSEEGKYTSGQLHYYDLENIPEKVKLTGWMNIYENGPGANIYHDKEGVDLRRDTGCIACLNLSKYNIEFEKGEGL